MIWKQFRRFLLFFCSFVTFSSLLFLLDFGPVQMASAWVFTTSHSRWSVPVHQIRRKVAIELYPSLVGLIGLYDCLRRIIVSFLVLFPSLLLYWVWQPSRSASKVGDNVMATHHPRVGKCQCIYVAARALRSVWNILPPNSPDIYSLALVYNHTTISYVYRQALAYMPLQILAGDMNSHCHRWDPRCKEQHDSTLWEEIIDMFKLEI